MARFARIDSQIRANRLILANLFRVPELNPLLCESRFEGLKIANRGFEAIRANRSHVMKTGVSLRIDSRESPRFALRIAGPSKVGQGMLVDGIAKFQALKFTFQGLTFPVKSLVLRLEGEALKFQALKFQNSGPEIWRLHPPPFHTPPFVCLILLEIAVSVSG